MWVFVAGTDIFQAATADDRRVLPCLLLPLLMYCLPELVVLFTAAGNVHHLRLYKHNVLPVLSPWS